MPEPRIRRRQATAARMARLIVSTAALPQQANAHKKRRRPEERRPAFQLRLVGAAAAGGTTAAATAPARVGERNFGLDGKAHVGQIDGHAAHRFQQVGGDAKLEAVLFKNLVFGGRLIQSQGEARSASAAGGEIHADGRLFLVGKIGFQLVGSRFANRNHCFFLRNG